MSGLYLIKVVLRRPCATVSNTVVLTQQENLKNLPVSAVCYFNLPCLCPSPLMYFPQLKNL